MVVGQRVLADGILETKQVQSDENLKCGIARNCNQLLALFGQPIYFSFESILTEEHANTQLLCNKNTPSLTTVAPHADSCLLDESPFSPLDNQSCKNGL